MVNVKVLLSNVKFLTLYVSILMLNVNTLI